MTEEISSYAAACFPDAFIPVAYGVFPGLVKRQVVFNFEIAGVLNSLVETFVKTP
jgi:hypothetical protein